VNGQRLKHYIVGDPIETKVVCTFSTIPSGKRKTPSQAYNPKRAFFEKQPLFVFFTFSTNKKKSKVRKMFDKVRPV